MKRSRLSTASYVTRDGSRVWELFHPGSSPVEGASIAEACVEAGRETKAHVHFRSVEVYYILEGSGKLRLGTETMAVSPGDAVLIGAGTAHCIRNSGDAPLRFLCICSPPYSHDDTRLAGQESIKPRADR